MSKKKVRIIIIALVVVAVGVGVFFGVKASKLKHAKRLLRALMQILKQRTTDRKS